MASKAERKLWQQPELTEVGNIVDVVQGGSAKLSASSADSGDLGKPPGGE